MKAALLFVLAMIAGDALADTGAQAKRYKAMIEQGKATVAATMKDPDSAKFETVGVFQDAQGDEFVCGMVNAKNSFGAYAGFELFIYEDRSESAKMQSNAAAGGAVDSETWAMIFARSCVTAVFSDGS